MSNRKTVASNEQPKKNEQNHIYGKKIESIWLMSYLDRLLGGFIGDLILANSCP